jgi:hypothetical protein
MSHGWLVSNRGRQIASRPDVNCAANYSVWSTTVASGAFF